MKFSPKVALILGAILAALEGVQLAITMSVQAHDAITLAIGVLSGLGVLIVTPSQIAKEVPHQLLVAITAVLGVLNIFQTSSLNVSTTAHVVIGIILVAGNAIFTTTGISTAIPPPATKEVVI